MATPNEPLEILDRIVSGKPTDLDLELLRQLLTTNKDQNLVQLGKYSVNIGPGHDIHIGDRIYQGADAVAIRQTVLSLLEARQFRTLLTHAEFSDRIEQSALASFVATPELRISVAPVAGGRCGAGLSLNVSACF